MVEYFLALAANFLLPQSTSSSRSLLAIHIPRLLLSPASYQHEMSRAQCSKGKRKGKAVVLGDDHGLFEHSDWLHIAHRTSSQFMHRKLDPDVSLTPPNQTVHFPALPPLGHRHTLPAPLFSTAPLSRGRRDMIRTASRNAEMYGTSPSMPTQYDTATLARPNQRYYLPPWSIASLMASPYPTLPSLLILNPPGALS
jgi:hypothetical protein